MFNFGYFCGEGVWVMLFNVTFNNISAISWRSVLLVQETGVLGENTDLPQVTDKLYFCEMKSNTYRDLIVFPFSI